MNLEDLEQELGAGSPRSAYLLAGDEPLLREDALGLLRTAVLGDADPEFNFDRFDASVAPGPLVDALRTLPVFAPRRLVSLIDPDAKRGGNKALLEAVGDWVGEADASDAVLVVASTKPDKRARWVKAFGDAVVGCEAPKRAREIAAFARAEAKRQSVTLERGVAEALAERVGPQLLLLRQEIAKLALLAGPGEAVTAAHVSAGTVLATEEPVWDLTDAIGEGRTADALRVLGRLLGSGAPPPVVLGALVSHFRRLLRTASGAEVPGPPFVRKKLATQARRYGANRLRSALGALHETDLALKGSGALRPELALERVVIALAV
ncbi:MAG: DNA polymerase III subunit delta [Myxococcota bacterium]